MNLRISDPSDRLHTTYAQPPAVAKPAMLCDDCQQDFMQAYAHKIDDDHWHVPSSQAGYYDVMQIAPGIWKCSCPGAMFRPTALCRHAEKVYALEHLRVSGGLPEIHLKYIPGEGTVEQPVAPGIEKDANGRWWCTCDRFVREFDCYHVATARRKAK